MVSAKKDPFAARFWKGLKVSSQRIKDAYNQNRRGFIEVTSAFGITGLLVIELVLLYSIWPVPPTPTPSHAISFHQSIVDVSPSITHLLALLGAFEMWLWFSLRMTRPFIHLSISLGIKLAKAYRSIKFRDMDKERLR